VTFPEILVLSVGLAMDATAVAAARGLAAPRVRGRDLVMVAGFFGGFQAVMPLVGWGLGQRLGPWIHSWDRWLAFAVFTGLGAKMLWEARSAGAKAGDGGNPDLAARTVLLLAVATSIDALAVGVMMPTLGAPLGLTVATIGLVTAVLSALGLLAGRWLGATLGPRLDLVGGLVLLGLGLRVLLTE
jgi:putative Mn2+ efflux pump MntP